MKIYLLIFISLATPICFSMPVNTGFLFEEKFYNLGQEYLSLLENLDNEKLEDLNESKKLSCLKRYKTILTDNKIEIDLLIGYFDWSLGYEIGSYGISPSIDPGAFAALTSLIQEPCSDKIQFCGFKKVNSQPNLYSRTVKIWGIEYPVFLSLNNSSVTEYFFENTGSLRLQQHLKSQKMEKTFEERLRDSDLVFYFGHSRKGGGPDFSPPHLNENHLVDYKNYYLKYQPGFKKLIKSLSAPPHQTKILGLMSCNSRDHFLSAVRSLAHDTGVITSTDIVNIETAYTAMIGAVDATLRGQCQKLFLKEIRMTSENQKFITMDGVFK